MKNCNSLRRIFFAAAILAVAATATLGGCTTTADYTLGEELAPGNQQMKMRYRIYSGGILTEADQQDTPCKIFETRLYRTDSLISSSLGTLYLGLQNDSRFGLRRMAFSSQFTFLRGVVDTVGFGFRPVYDSALFRFKVDTFAGDSTKPVKYNVYALTSDLVNEESEDSTFYISYDARKAGHIADDAQPIFTFNFPDPDKGVYPSSTSVRMSETPLTREFINRIWCINTEDSDWDGMATHNIEAYSTDSAFIHTFKGLYVEPAEETIAEGAGSLAAFDPTATGFELLGRTRNQGADADIMADTLDYIYYFKLESATRGNVSANSVKFDYTNADFAAIPIEESVADRPQVELGYVDGCGGVLTELKFTDEFLASLRNIHSGDDEYVSAAINQASLSIYFEKSDYDYTKLDPIAMAEAYETAMPRLGMYTNYKKLTPVADYWYTQETSGTSLAYDGYINRSLGCYKMNISSYIQTIINEVLKLEPDSSGKIDYSKVNGTTIYLGPTAYDQYTFNRSVVQGGDYTINPASIRLELTYTLVK